MSSLYIHIPFCKKRCSYCNFHFSTNLSLKKDLLKAINKEIFLQKDFLKDKSLKSIYFGGGTPSLMEYKEIMEILSTIDSYYIISKETEITLEANPDDLSLYKLKGLYNACINRLSIGVESFYKEDLIFMNRTHEEQQAKRAIIEAKQVGFSNISIDLIYGSSSTTNQMWSNTITYAVNSGIQHISAYSLTVEPKTKLFYQIKKGVLNPLDENKQIEQYGILTRMLLENDFIHYEISNFGKKTYFSRHNTSYWNGSSYLGIGPSAHSYDGEKRSWNISNNKIYIESIKKDVIPCTQEELKFHHAYNEEVMMGLRTKWGINLDRIKKIDNNVYFNYLMRVSKKYLDKNILVYSNGRIYLSYNYWIYADGIASDLFFV